MSIKLPLNTRKKLQDYLVDMRPSSNRAQIINIINIRLDDDETIAERIIRDHITIGGALRAMMLMSDAGAATHKSKNPDCYGTFTFEDGSTFN